MNSLTPLTENETKYYTLVTLCSASPVGDSRLIIGDVVSNANARHDEYPDNPVFSCIQNDVKSTVLLKPAVEIFLDLLQGVANPAACSTSIDTYDGSNFDTDYKSLQILRCVRQLYSDIDFVNGKVAQFIQSTGCPFENFLLPSDSTYTAQKTLFMTSWFSWVSEGGYFWTIDGLANRIKTTYDDLVAKLGTNPDGVDVDIFAGSLSS
jgi:hypothetical protein